MNNIKKGFTLIELIVVIIILSIIAAVITPKFLGLSDDADASVGDGQGGAIRGGSNLNFAKSKAGTGGVTIAEGDDCSTKINAMLQDGGLGNGWSVDATYDAESDGAGNVQAAAGDKVGKCKITKGSKERIVSLALTSDGT